MGNWKCKNGLQDELANINGNAKFESREMGGTEEKQISRDADGAIFSTPLSVEQKNDDLKDEEQQETQTNQQRTQQRRRPRVGGSSAKTAECWRFFTQRPNGEPATTCSICTKTIRATNSRWVAKPILW